MGTFFFLSKCVFLSIYRGLNLRGDWKSRGHTRLLLRLAGALAESVSGGGSVASLHLEKALRPGLMRSANVLLFPT